MMATQDQNTSHVQSFFDKRPEVEFVRWQWVDATALVRYRLTTVRQTLKLATENRSMSLYSPALNAFLIDGDFNEVYAGAKDSLIPDWSTLVQCHYHPNHAAVLCFIDEPGKDFKTCPRSLLKNLEASVKDKHDMTFLIGIEVEFYLAASPGSTSPIKGVNGTCSAASMRDPAVSILEDAVRSIEKAGIPIWTVHSELRAGLFELQTEPLTPLAAADALIYVHEAIRATAAAHGLHATMHPKPFDDTHGVGQHIHISLSRQTDKDDSFLAGVLASVPAISAVSRPAYDSYLRNDFAGGEWVGWDLENRLASVRKIRRAYWEFRFVDCTANVYLVLAAILGTGMAAWERGDELTIKPFGGRMTHEIDESVAKELKLVKRVPEGLKEAVSALKEDENVLKVLGKEVGERFVRYKTKEEAMMAALSLPERRKMCVALF